MRITDQLEKPAECGHAIALAQSKPRGVWRQSLGDRPRVVEDAPDGVCHELADRLWVIPLRKQIGRDSRRPGDGEAAKRDPLPVVESSAVQPDVRAAGLFAAGQGELVAVGGKVADTAQRCG